MGVTEKAATSPKRVKFSVIRPENDVGRMWDQSTTSQSKNQAMVTSISKAYHPFLTHTTAWLGAISNFGDYLSNARPLTKRTKPKALTVVPDGSGHMVCQFS
jgi:hypothetical protein